MKRESYLIINKNGIVGHRKTKPQLNWNEIAVKIVLDIPDELFTRPHLEATIRVDKNKITPNQINPDIILNTKNLIEQQTGARIDMRVIEYETKDKEDEE